MAIISTPAIVLRSIDHRETSKIAFLFTRRRGKVKGVLKGIRKNPRKFGSSLEKFSVNDIVYYEYRDSEIHLISQCDMKECFFAFRGQARRIVAADYAAELVNRITAAEDPNPAIYDLLLDYYRALAVDRDIDRLVHMFQIKFLAFSGFRPHIDSCVTCGKGLNEKMPQAKFSMVKGGLICRNCQGKDLGLWPVSPGMLATLLYVERESWPGCLKLHMPAGIKLELKRILNNFLVFHLEKNIRSAKYLS